MTERAIVDTTRGQVEWSFERPPGFKVLRQPVPDLAYPWEVAGAGDWDFPPNRVTSEAEEELYGAHPRLDLMPPSGVFVWLLMGDVRRENEVEPGSWPSSPPHKYIAPAGVAPANGDASMQVAPLTSVDANRVGSWWGSLSSWGRIALLTDARGATDDEPLYLVLQAFAGPQRSNMSAVSSLVSSLSYRYVG